MNWEKKLNCKCKKKEKKMLYYNIDSDKEYYNYWGIYINEKIVKKDYLID